MWTIVGRLVQVSYSSRVTLNTRNQISRLFSTNGKSAPKSPAPTLCQVNDHPNYRLKLAKKRFAASANPLKGHSKPKQMYTSPKRLKTPSKSMKYHESVRERGISVQYNENPEIKNDGTSSGAIAADRLRMARRKALESLARPIDAESNTQSVTKKKNLTKHPAEDKPVKEHGIDVVVCENPVRTNDGTSSGALAADRLRMARRKALESLALPVDAEPNAQSDIEKKNCTQNQAHDKPVKEHGIDIVVCENPVRANDGTSSGALAADRLRMARRKALESLSNSIPDTP